MPVKAISSFLRLEASGGFESLQCMMEVHDNMGSRYHGPYYIEKGNWISWKNEIMFPCEDDASPSIYNYHIIQQ